MYEDIKNEIERRILELMSLAGEAAVAEKLTIPDIGELTFVDEENLHITPKGAVMRGWDDWHMVREFVQNSLDAVGKVDMAKIGDTLIISDLGAGFDVDAFIIGGTTKDPFCSRGRFGEGMKYAICVALNKGYDLTIITKDNVMKFRLKVAKGYTVPTVHMIRYKTSKPIVGTRIIISNYPGPSFRERFILYDRNDAYRLIYIVTNDRTRSCGPTGIFHQCIMDPPQAIFVRDIFVENKDKMLFSYNLVDVELDADRNIPKGYMVEEEITRLWLSCISSDLIYELLERISNHESTKYFETRTVEGSFDWDYALYRLKSSLAGLPQEEKEKILKERYRKPWEEAVRRYEDKIVKKLCHAYQEYEEATANYYSGYLYESAARHFGKRISEFLNRWGIIPSAEDVVIEHAPKGTTEVSSRELKAIFGDEGYKVIMRWLKYLKNIADYFGLTEYKVVAGRSSSKGVRGACNSLKKIIYIMVDTFRYGFEEVLAVFAHELVHAKYELLDQESNTAEFLKKQLDIMLKIQIGTIERRIPLPRDFPFRLP